MAWSSPRTWISTEVVTASQLNTELRDNLLQTAPAKATTVGGLFVTSGTNTILERIPQRSTITTSESTGSTSYTDLATAGPAVTVTTGTAALVMIYARLRNDTTNGSSYMSYAVSGASSDSATDTRALLKVAESSGNNPIAATAFGFHTGLTSGSNIFTAKYRTGTGGSSATYQDRRIFVFPF